MSIYRNAVKRPITTLMIFVAVVVFGTYSLINLPVDLYPDIEFPSVTVMTTYGGANATDIETNVTKPIEDALNAVDNLKEISSVSRDNLSVITCEFEYEANLNEAANDIRNALSLVETELPDAADDPVVYKLSSSMMPIMMFSITADESYEGIEKMLDERLINPLNRIEGIGSINLQGLPQREVQVDIDPAKLKAHNLTLKQIGNKIKAENLNMPLGNVKMGQMKYPARVNGEFESSRHIRNMIVANQKGGNIYLKDVATVTDSIGEMTINEKINGEKGVRMMIMKQSGANTVEIAENVRNRMKELKPQLPEDVKVETIIDSSDFIDKSISNLETTLMFAFLFVVLVVLFFLGRWRATFIIVLTIPVALIVSFTYLHITGSTLNIMSLSSLAIAIGMVVDDAIVVLENITKHIERGTSPRESSIYATNEVWLAVIVTTLTVVAVFFPMTLVSGLSGIMFRQIGWIVTITVVASTLAAITLTPMLCSKLLRVKRSNSKQRKFSYDNTVLSMLNSLDEWYGRVLRWCLHHKVLITVGAIIIFIASLFLNRFIGTEFMPQPDQGTITMTVELRSGTRLEETSRIARKVDEILHSSSFPEIEVISTSAGSQEEAGLSAVFQTSGSNIINYNLSLSDASERKRSSEDIAEKIRMKLRDIPKIKTYNVNVGRPQPGMSNKVNINIYGYNLDKTTQLAHQLSTKVKKIKGARNVNISREEARPELQIKLNRDKITKLGLNTAMISSSLRNRIDGLTATQFREFGEEYDVIVRYKEEARNSITDIENMIVYNPMGKTVHLGEIARVKEVWSPPNIERMSRERVVTVSAKPYQTSMGGLAQSMQQVLNETDIPEEMNVEVGGAYEDQMEGFKALGLLLVISLILVYIVMASQFESMKMPLIIMFSIPFAFTGVFLGLFITDTVLSVIAGLGAIMLIGIVVKNAVVLVDYINLMRDRGYDLDEAIVISGKARLRPVLMTAFTTILGMLPLALGIGEGSEIWSPMGVAVIGGLIFSTVVTMIIVPVMYRELVRRGERARKEKVWSHFRFMDI